ncbi:MAG TPA: hypothetical protein VL403_20185, partial [Candidatus Kryptonia bacterium]|nr:hypothetical protein [Candidatus Kryptonia bacterium]
MALTDIEVTLTDQEREIRTTARRFAEETMRPAGHTLDRLPDPADVIAPKSILWDVFKKYWSLNLDVLDYAGPEL